MAELIPDRPAKTTFHCCAVPQLLEQLYGRNVRHVTVAGIEAHVCVAQTALELLDLGFRVQVPADAVASRHKIDWEFALRRLEQAGAVVSTTEAVLFEWTETADRPEFKAISELIKTMNRARRPTCTDSPWDGLAVRPTMAGSCAGRAIHASSRSLFMPVVPKPPTPGPLHLSKRVLMGPGPSDVHPRVLQALATPLVGHLDPEFAALMDETQDLLRYVFQTENRLTLAISGTGSAGMETVVVNLIEPGDKMLVCINGVFGARMKDVAERAGAVVSTIERPYGEVFDPDEVKAAVAPRPSQGRRDRPCRDLDGRLAAGRGDRQDRPRRRCADRARHRHLAGGRSGRDRRLGYRRGLFRNAEMPELPARPGAGVVRPAGRRGLEPAQDEGPELVPRPVDDPALLGERPFLSSHGADQHELRAARGAGTGGRRRTGGADRATRAERPGAARRTGRDGALRWRPPRATACRS